MRSLQPMEEASPVNDEIMLSGLMELLAVPKASPSLVLRKRKYTMNTLPIVVSSA